MSTTPTHLTPAELDTLLEAARAATSGEWLRSSLAVAYVVSEKGYPVIAAFAEYDVDGSIHKEFENGVANQEFVIRANPATITRLVLMVRELRQRLGQAQIETSVINGSACREEQEAGNGPCGICRYCLSNTAIEHFRARAVEAILRRAAVATTVEASVEAAEISQLIESLPLVETEEGDVDN